MYSRRIEDQPCGEGVSAKATLAQSRLSLMPMPRNRRLS
jgi:hypothetical protein